jgi:CO/xanthine dehydrogenase Mo-binding subunit
METCGAVADFDRVSGNLTVWCTTQAPHAHRTLYLLVTGLAEHKIRVVSPDIGGGFGNKVPIYPGCMCAIVGSIVTGKPVPITRPDSFTCSPAPTIWRLLTVTFAGCTRTRRRAESRTRARSASPRASTSLSGWSTVWPASVKSIQPSCA